MIGIAGLDATSRIEVVMNALGLNQTQRDPARDEQNHNGKTSQRLGDRARNLAYKGGFAFSDYAYAVKTSSSGIAWREGREAIFGRPFRKIPFMLDSSGYRREISRTALGWSHEFENYLASIELTDPDGFAAWDYPNDRAKSLEYLARMESLFPGDQRLWPIFSIRWTWDDKAHLAFSRTPKWVGKNLTYLIPANRTQRQYAESSRELWVRQAIANAIVVANDPDFRMMADRFGKVMLGGMVAGPCPRLSRHVFLAAISRIRPDVKCWALGQAHYAAINGLAQLGMLGQVFCDGSWYLRDAAAERMAIVEKGLITMISLETRPGERLENGRRESFFTFSELMAANLRSLLSAYAGLIKWPNIEWPSDLPLSPLPLERAKELQAHYQAAQLELGL